MENIRIGLTLCILCKTCIRVCSKQIIAEGDREALMAAPSQCTLHGHCKAVCPENASYLPSMAQDEFPLPLTEMRSSLLMHFSGFCAPGGPRVPFKIPLRQRLCWREWSRREICANRWQSSEPAVRGGPFTGNARTGA
jgi:ferredoxin